MELDTLLGEARIELSLALYIELAELAGGSFPVTLEDWRNAAKKLRYEIVIGPPGVYRPLVDGLGRFILLPQGIEWIEQQVFLIHEIGELIMRYELRPAIVYPPSWGDHHDVAKRAEADYRRAYDEWRRARE